MNTQISVYVFLVFLYYRFISTCIQIISFLNELYWLRFFPLKRFFLGDGWVIHLLNTPLYGPSSACIFIKFFMLL